MAKDVRFDKLLCVRIESQVFEEMQEAAKGEGLSDSEFIRKAIAEAIASTN